MVNDDLDVESFARVVGEAIVILKEKYAELERLAEIGKAVERQLDKSFWMNKYDLENLMDWYREQSTK